MQFGCKWGDSKGVSTQRRRQDRPNRILLRCAKQDLVVAWETARSRKVRYVDVKKTKISRKRNNVEIEIERGVEKYALRLRITVE